MIKIFLLIILIYISKILAEVTVAAPSALAQVFNSK